MVVIMDDGTEQLTMPGESIVIEPLVKRPGVAVVSIGEDFEPIRNMLNEWARESGV